MYLRPLQIYRDMRLRSTLHLHAAHLPSCIPRTAWQESFAQGKLVFFAGGTGHPYFSTDTATVLRAVEIEAEAILLAKAVDGIYDSDPEE